MYILQMRTSVNWRERQYWNLRRVFKWFLYYLNQMFRYHRMWITIFSSNTIPWTFSYIYFLAFYVEPLFSLLWFSRSPWTVLPGFSCPHSQIINELFLLSSNWKAWLSITNVKIYQMPWSFSKIWMKCVLSNESLVY